MKYPTGKGMMIWMLEACAGGSAFELADKAINAGFSWVAVKIQDGTKPFQPGLLDPAINSLRGVGISVWGWGYLYGGDWLGRSQAQKEGVLTVALCEDLGLDGYLIDVEVQYKRTAAHTWANTYMTTVRASLPDIPLGLCSYRYPSYHPQLPWRNFLAYCDFHAPQVYWALAHNPGDQLRRSVRELTAIKNLPVVPVGSAYKEHTWPGPTVGELDEFDATAKELKLPGLSWWSWQHAEANGVWWDAIANHQWETGDGDSPPPSPAPAPAPGGKLQMRVVQDGLRKRTGPGTEFAQVGNLNDGDIVEVLDIGGSSAWVEIRPGEWANVQYGDDRNMEMAP